MNSHRRSLESSNIGSFGTLVDVAWWKGVVSVAFLICVVAVSTKSAFFLFEPGGRALGGQVPGLLEEEAEPDQRSPIRSSH